MLIETVLTTIRANPIGWALLLVSLLLTVVSVGMRINNLRNARAIEKNRLPLRIAWVGLILIFAQLFLGAMHVTAPIAFTLKIIGFTMMLHNAIEVVWCIIGIKLFPKNSIHKQFLLAAIIGTIMGGVFIYFG
jgi:hypothetical protein